MSPNPIGNRVEQLAQSLAEHIVPLIVDAIDIDSIIDKVDVEKIIERVDVDQIVERVDIQKIIERVDVQQIIERVDINAIVNQSVPDTAQSPSGSGGQGDPPSCPRRWPSCREPPAALVPG